jgi:hypothetical protein
LIHHRQNKDFPQVIEARRAVFMEQFTKLFNQATLKSEADIRMIVNAPTLASRLTREAGIVGTGKSLDLKIRSGDGSEIAFRVKDTTSFRNILSSYAKMKGVYPNGIPFFLKFDGERIMSTQSPGTFDMEDDDVIDAIFIQLGC